MAIDPIILSKRRKKLPGVWALVEAFLKKHGGQVHLNWGAPFSVRTKLREGRLDQLRLPEGVSFTTNRDLFRGPYTRTIGRPAIHLGWEVQGGEKVDERVVETLRGMARRHAEGVVAPPKKPRGPRLTGRRPSAAQLCPRLPIRMRSVLLLADGRRLELTLERGGRVSRVS
jgi:hypothetical protein